MSTLLYSLNRNAVPADENKLRSTADPVDEDAPAAEASGAPEWNERETDPNPNLTGLVNRQVASDWHAVEKYSPAWAAYANPTASFAEVNGKMDAVGTAAAREMRGEQGHGTMAYAVGIEPTLRDGSVFGADYFAVNEKGAQENVTNYMSVAPGLDHDHVAATAGAAKGAARDAAASSQYGAWYSAMMGR